MMRSGNVRRRHERGRRIGSACALVAALGLTLGGVAGCDDETKRQMGEAFVGSLEEGLTTILSGAVAGVFAGVSGQLGLNSSEAATE